MKRLLLLTIALLRLGLLTSADAQESLTEVQKVAKPQSIDELLLFFPAKYPTGDWQPKDLRFDDVYFTADDKTQLHGWYCPCDNPRAVILLAHGNASDTLCDFHKVVPLLKASYSCGIGLVFCPD
jgi:hypothetical protein